MLLLTSVKMLKTSYMRSLHCFMSLSITRKKCQSTCHHRGIILKRVTSQQEMTIDDWKALRSQSNKPILTFACTCLEYLKPHLQPSRSLLSFLESENALNLYIKCQFFQTLKQHQEHCTPEDHKFIESTVCEVFKQFPQFYLNKELSQNLMIGISIIPSWKEYGYKIIEGLESTGCNMMHHNAHLEFARAAFLNDDIDLLFKLLDEINTKYFSTFPAEMMIDFVLDNIDRLHDTKTQESVIIRLLQYTSVIPHPSTAWKLAEWFQNRSEGWLARFTEVNERGQCATCQMHLKMQPLTEDELSTLRTEVLENIVRQYLINLHCKEFCAFEDFLEQAGPYTIVLDAGIYGSDYKRAHVSIRVKGILSSLKKRGEKVIIVGSKSLLIRCELRDILMQMNCFVTTYRWKYELLVLYAAMRGQGAYLITDEKFSDLKCRVKKKSTLNLLLKWLAQKKVLLNSNCNCAVFPSHDNIYQISKDGCTLHIPYVFNFSADRRVDCQRYLCVRNVGKKLKKQLLNRYPLVKPGLNI